MIIFQRFVRDFGLFETLVNLFFNPDGDQYLIASGGDDNSINVVLFDISTNSIVNQLSFTSAHAAQITGSTPFKLFLTPAGGLPHIVVELY